jgi:hypothetical protein
MVTLTPLYRGQLQLSVELLPGCIVDDWSQNKPDDKLYDLCKRSSTNGQRLQEEVTEKIIGCLGNVIR